MSGSGPSVKVPEPNFKQLFSKYTPLEKDIFGQLLIANEIGDQLNINKLEARMEANHIDKLRYGMYQRDIETEAKYYRSKDVANPQSSVKQPSLQQAAVEFIRGRQFTPVYTMVQLTRIDEDAVAITSTPKKTTRLRETRKCTFQ